MLKTQKEKDCSCGKPTALISDSLKITCFDLGIKNKNVPTKEFTINFNVPKNKQY